ncbi:MAG: M20/M25/M40 family metallo-hydrolase, partial [Actinomycetota bacterium]
MNGARELGQHVQQVWSDEIVPELCDYIEIPCVSSDYDPDWKAHGHLDRAVEQIRRWCAARPIAGLSVEVMELPGRTPLIIAEVSAFGGGDPDDTVMLYGHCDKQPEMTGWRDDLGPWKPVIEGDRLYGRGGADDGYAAFASLLAIEAAQAAGHAHTRLIVLIEASEESGSPDLPDYLHALRDRIGSPSLVLCLDSGCIDHERLWVTTSLRGLVSGVLRVEVLEEGVHSGEASGVVPSSFRIARQLLDRLEDSATGKMLLRELYADIPPDRLAQAADTAAEFPIEGHYPWVQGVRPIPPVLRRRRLRGRGRQRPPGLRDHRLLDQDQKLSAGVYRHRHAHGHRSPRGEAVGRERPRPAVAAHARVLGHGQA